MYLKLLFCSTALAITTLASGQHTFPEKQPTKHHRFATESKAAEKPHFRNFVHRNNRPQQRQYKTAATKEALDSIIYFEVENGQNVKFYREFFTYNGSGLNTKYEYAEWNANNQKWQIEEKDEMQFTSNGLLSERNYFHLDSTSQTWKNTYREELMYDANDSLVEHKYWSFNSQTQLLETSSKVTYSYNNQGIQEATYYSKDAQTGLLTQSDKDVYSYNAANLHTETLSYYWNSGMGVWDTNSRSTFTYNANNALILEINQQYSNGSWENYYKSEISFSNGGLTIARKHFYWNNASQMWDQETYYYQYTLNANGNEISFSDFYYNPGTGQYEETNKYTYTYDLNVNSADLLYPYFFGNYYKNKILSANYSEKDTATNNWVVTYDEQCYYSNKTIGIAELPTSAFSLYPNPVNNELQIELNTTSSNAVFEVYDAMGRTLIQQQIGLQHKVDLGHLSAGLYTYLIKIDGKQKAGKLIKQ